MAIIGELLFYSGNGPDQDDLLRHQASQGLAQAVDAIPEGNFAEHTDEELAARVVERAALQPLIVDFDKAEPQVAPTTVTVRDFGLMVTVKGYRITKNIPFSGGPQLWTLRTNPANFSPPRGEVRRGHLIIGRRLKLSAQPKNWTAPSPVSANTSTGRRCRSRSTAGGIGKLFGEKASSAA
jgi:hypothetical protein